MSDIKLFQTSAAGVAELPGGDVLLEKSLQNLFESNLETLLGVRFLASEFVTNEGGRMDTLGIDENNAPVVIEYKRSSNENVINQGLFYLDWLMGHRKDFEWLVLKKLGESEAGKVDWSGPRLICIAGDFGKYDEHAVKQMNRNIALVRYRRGRQALPHRRDPHAGFLAFLAGCGVPRRHEPAVLRQADRARLARDPGLGQDRARAGLAGRRRRRRPRRPDSDARKPAHVGLMVIGFGLRSALGATSQ